MVLLPELRWTWVQWKDDRSTTSVDSRLDGVRRKCENLVGDSYGPVHTLVHTQQSEDWISYRGVWNFEFWIYHWRRCRHLASWTWFPCDCRNRWEKKVQRSYRSYGNPHSSDSSDNDRWDRKRSISAIVVAVIAIALCSRHLTECKIRHFQLHFHFVVLQRWLRNVQKNVMQVQNRCFVTISLFLFRRRRRCLSSLMPTLEVLLTASVPSVL